MPEREVIRRARRDAEEGKTPSTQAGEFVREEMRHIRQGKHGARSTKQAIAIGLSEARRAGVKLPAKRSTSARTRTKARRDIAKGRKRTRTKVSVTRSRAVTGALGREGRRAASTRSLARQARSTARRRGAAARSAAARKAARTKAAAGRSAAARKAARTRARNRR
jgi:Family of unknown function (DUF6496)